MKLWHGILLIFAVCTTLSPAQAQWWGTESLPGNSNSYTYRTRFGNWQYGGLTRNIVTPQAYADRGIIRNWEDGTIIAVDRNIPSGRFAQPGVPNLVYIPRIDYFDDLGYLTDIRYQEGLRQYWPEDGHLLIDEWEQVAYEPDRLPPNTVSSGTSAPAVSKNVQQPVVIIAPPQQQRQKQQTVIVRQVPTTKAPKKITYHQQIMQRNAERHAAEEERLQQQIALAEQAELAARQTAQGYVPQQHSTEGESLWFRGHSAQPIMSQIGPAYEMSASIYIIPTNPVLEIEKRLEYSLVQSPEVSFFSPFQVKYNNSTATVIGTVGSQQEKQAAERILLKHPEIKNIINYLSIAE